MHPEHRQEDQEDALVLNRHGCLVDGRLSWPDVVRALRCLESENDRVWRAVYQYTQHKDSCLMQPMGTDCTCGYVERFRRASP